MRLMGKIGRNCGMIVAMKLGRSWEFSIQFDKIFDYTLIQTTLHGFDFWFWTLVNLGKLQSLYIYT